MSWMDEVNQISRPAAPPKTGKGSSRAAWAEHATVLGHEIPADTPRARIIALIESGPPQGPNRKALEIQVEAMATGREHRALIEACRSLADRVDRARGFDDKAWREYRLALKELREAVVDGGTDPDGDIAGELRDAFRNPTNAE